MALLGVNEDFDKRKLAEDKKQNIRKAVKVAYERAQAHLRRVTCTESDSDDNKAQLSTAHLLDSQTLAPSAGDVSLPMDSGSDKMSTSDMTDHTSSEVTSAALDDDHSVDMPASITEHAASENTGDSNSGDLWTSPDKTSVASREEDSVSSDSDADLADDSASDTTIPLDTGSPGHSRQGDGDTRDADC